MALSRNIRIIISGGGTGGHVFPAIAIADALKARLRDVEILFVGADNRLEMEKVPEAGYRITGLPVRGFVRKLSFSNIIVLVRFINSLRLSKKILIDFKPDAVVGVGGYASGPVLVRASGMGIPTLIQEQNSFAGLTNRLLSRRADKICVAYHDMERFFPSRKLVMTGNPVRKEIEQGNTGNRRKEAISHFSLDPGRKVILVLGGSLGARTVNTSIMSKLDLLIKSDIQVLWQCGKTYYDQLVRFIGGSRNQHLILLDFISRMDLAYAAADLIISRAGAITVSELTFAGKPAILVPSPNVAEDHQTKNAMALVKEKAAVHVADHEAEDHLVSKALDILKDEQWKRELSGNLASLAVKHSALRIADEIIGMLK